MKNIDDYIQRATNMKNTSDGGSPAYHFDDVVLIKYEKPIEYGIPREREELIAQKANEKNAKGVRTPAHLSIKRVIDGDNGICWVLQERAKGISFDEYCSNEACKVQLNMQSRLVNAPDTHYEKLVSDVCELYNLGIELKPKNLYYDESIQDGGFTIIDLSDVYDEPFNHNSLRDVLRLCEMLGYVYISSRIRYYDKNATQSDKDISTQLYYKIKQKVFSAMEKTIPNFDQHRRWVLRSFLDDELYFFSNNGTNVGNLALNEKDYEQFDQTIKDIVGNSLKSIENGTNKYWGIIMKVMGTDLVQLGMQDAWRYHKLNNNKLSDFYGESAEYEYEHSCAKDLETILTQRFDEELDIISSSSTNPLVLNAKNDLDIKRELLAQVPKQL